MVGRRAGEEDEKGRGRGSRPLRRERSGGGARGGAGVGTGPGGGVGGASGKKWAAWRRRRKKRVPYRLSPVRPCIYTQDDL